MSNRAAAIETEETNDIDNPVDNDNYNDTENEYSISIHNKVSADHYDILFKLREENNYLMIKLRDHESLKIENTYMKGKLDEIEKDNLLFKNENG